MADQIDLGGFTSSSDDDDDDNDAYEEKKSESTAISRSRSVVSVPSSSNARSIKLATNHRSKSISKLSAYYGTPQSAGSNGRSRENTPSMSQDEMHYDFKSKHFSAEKFVEKKVADMTVNELVSYSNQLNQGVKALDSEMQMMVYDNYNKFISATDTIRKMKDQVENMEAEMSKLLSNMENIATNCSKIEDTFSPNRSEIEKLVSVRGLLKKLEFLFELPNRLRRNIELGAYDRAVKYFKMATSILSSYKHIQSFNRISIESQEIINDLQENLKKQMVKKDISAFDQLKIAKLLLSLNQQPELLWYDIFRTRKDALFATIIELKEAERLKEYYQAQETDELVLADHAKQPDEEKQESNPFAADMAGKDEEEQQQQQEQDALDETNPFANDVENDNEQDAKGGDTENANENEAEADKKAEDEVDASRGGKKFFSVIEYFRVGFLTLFIDFVERYNEVFITPFQVDTATTAANKQSKYLSVASSGGRPLARSRSAESIDDKHKSKKNRKTKKADEQKNDDDDSNKRQQYEKSMAALTSFSRDIFSEYFNVMKSCLQREENVDKLTEELQSFYDALYAPSKLVPNARLQDKGTELIESCIRKAMQREFVNTRKKQLFYLIRYMRNSYDIERIVVNCKQYNASNNEFHIKKCVLYIKNESIQCLNHLVPLTTNQSQLINILDLNFDDQLWSYTANLFKIFSELIPIELRSTYSGGDAQNLAVMMNENEKNEEEAQFIDTIYRNLDSELPPIKLLILSKILIGIGNNVVEEIVKHFRKNFLYDRDNKHASLGIYKQEVLLFQRYCQECSNGLRLLYSQRIATLLIAHIDALEAADNRCDAEKRTQIVKDMEQQINVSIANLRKIYNLNEEEVNGKWPVAHNLNQNQHPHDVGNMMMSNTHGNDNKNVNMNNNNLREYDKLFNEGCLIYDRVSDDANTVLFTVFKIVCKHWSEMLRLQTIRSQMHVDLIQRDVQFWRSHIPKIIHKKEFNKVQTLLDEVQQSAKERCCITTTKKKHANDNHNNNNQDDTVDID